MTMENLSKANELAKQIGGIERRIEKIRLMLADNECRTYIYAQQSDRTTEALFEGDEAKDMLRKHLVDLTAKHELMLIEFERL